MQEVSSYHGRPDEIRSLVVHCSVEVEGQEAQSGVHLAWFCPRGPICYPPPRNPTDSECWLDEGELGERVLFSSEKQLTQGKHGLTANW